MPTDNVEDSVHVDGCHASDAGGLCDHVYEYRQNYHFSPGEKWEYRFLTAIIPCLTGIGSMYQAVAAARDVRIHPPPGKLINIDGCQIHVQATGHGGPSVVLESGLGGMSSAWGWIQPEMAKFSRVVSYDRGGLGWSGPDIAPKTATLTARRLRSVLLHSEVPPPYVLVGHSMGGLFIRVFAALYPNEIAGIVLLDAVHPDQHLRSVAISTHMRTGFRFLEAVPLLTRLGFVRLAGIFNVWAEGLPTRQAAEAKSFLSTFQHLKTTRDESLAWETICAEVRSTNGLADIPLAVVTAAKGVLPGHPELQRELTALSSDSVHFTVKGADHVTLVTRREYAMVVVEAIRHVVERAKSSRRSGIII
jgi:pimeloyl-ACP methyl ester carboxylesterase